MSAERHKLLFLPSGISSLTGNSATSAIGAVVVGLALALSGIAPAGAIGTVGPQITVAISGVSGTGGVGNVILTEDALTGVDSTGAVGTVSPVPTLSVSGNVGTTAIGDVDNATGVALSGEVGTSAAGNLGVTEAENVALIGNAATGAAGAVTPSLTLPASGNVGTTAIGTLGVTEAENVALNGNAATSAVGSVTPTFTRAASGNVGTTALGDVENDTNITGSGNVGTTALGTLGVTEDENVALNGNAATGAVGTISPSTSAAISGVSATGHVNVVYAYRQILKHEYAVYLRFTGYNYGSIEAYRSAAWHQPLLVDLPEPEESLRDEFGIQSGDTLEVTVADTALRATLEGGTLDGAAVTLEWVTTTHYLVGDPVVSTFTRIYTVQGYSYRPGTATLRLVNIEDTRLTAVYPVETFTVANWPELFTEHVGRAVPVAVGTAIKIPCTLIQTAAGVGPWKFAVTKVIGVADTVLTAYRNGRVVDSGEYTVGTLTSGGYTVRTLSFAAEQVDFSGNLHEITCDVTANSSSNAVTELNRILVAAGVTVDATTFAAGVTVATSNVMRVDTAYTEQREYSAIIYDLLQVCRASLKRNDVGAYALVQDTAQSVTWTYNESYGDLISVTEYNSAEAPQSFTLAYRPDGSRYQYLISRNVGGVSGTEHLDAPFVRDHECADRLNDYLAKRRQYGATARADVYIDNIELGQVLSLTSDSMWSGAKSWQVRGVRLKPGYNELDLLQYNAGVYSYTSQTYPGDATTGYSPDYSATPPAVPTSVTVVSGGVTLNQDGVAQSYVLVKSTPPTLNWKEVWFQATNTVTNEIYQGVGSNNGDGTYGTKLAGLRPNVAHNLVSWAVNAFNVKGVVSTAVNFTSTAWTSAPSAPTGLSSVQGTGKSVQVRWTAPSGTNIGGYEVSRSVNAGSYSVVDTVQSTTYPDNNVTYGSSYTYRLRTVDRVGNFSGNSGTTAITPVVNVDTPDLVPGGVTTPIRQNMASAASNFTLSPGLASFEFTHGLNKIPTAVPFSGNASVSIWVISRNTSVISLGVYNFLSINVGTTLGFDYW